MYFVADTGALVAQGVLTPAQADVIKKRSREAMVALALNCLLIGGIIAATFGLVFLLADAVLVAVWGSLSVAAGLLILAKGRAAYRIFGNASALIGAGMLAAGAGFELARSYPVVATPGMVGLGAVMAALAVGGYLKGAAQTRFAAGAVLVMGAGLVVAGVYFGATFYAVSGWPMPAIHLVVFAIIAVVGWFLDLRIVTALAIVPFAQMMDTGTFYRHAMYVFYSPEPTLSILQMGALIAVCLWVARAAGPRTVRQAGVLAIMAFIVANLCFLVGSLWGDVVGQSLWGPVRVGGDHDAFVAARDAFMARAVVIPEGVYAVIWAILLAAVAIWTATRNKRGLFNTAVTFGAIHAYTQVFESFGTAPLAYVVSGLSAIPLVWGMWRLNERFKLPA